MTERTTLYRHFDGEGNLLYVGISVDHIKRTQDHSRSAKWFDDIANVTIENFVDRQAALDAERSAIENERPRYNIVHGDYKKDTMDAESFRAIRLRLGFTQAQLASFLGYGSPMRVSEFERETNPRPVPDMLARLMIAYDEGYRPKDWPETTTSPPAPK